MAKRIKKLCKRCAKNLTDNISGYCDDCSSLFAKKKATLEKHNRLPAHKRGYDNRWHRFSKQFLENNPICAICGLPATVTDHKIPIQVMRDVYGDNVLEDEYYLPLCHSCNLKKWQEHDKQVIEEYFKKKEEIPSGIVSK